MDDDQRALYIISVAAELAGVHPQTLRIYERKGLIEPSRTEGRSRRYSDRDIALLQRIQELTNDGVSLAGVRRILELEAELEELRAHVATLDEALARARADRESAVREVHRSYRRDLVPVSRAVVRVPPALTEGTNRVNSTIKARLRRVDERRDGSRGSHRGWVTRRRNMHPTKSLTRRVCTGIAALSLALGGALGALVIVASPASADTIPVANTADDGTNTSLRYVLEHATDGDVVVLTADATYTLNCIEGGDIGIVASVTIEGNGATIQQTCPDRVLYTKSALTLNEVTITGGNVDGSGGGLFEDNTATVSLNGATFTGNTASSSGGGLATSGDLTITDSIFNANHDTGGDGGAIKVFSDTGTTTIAGSTFTDNTTNGWGGAFEQQLLQPPPAPGVAATTGYALHVTGSTFTGNTAADEGGGALDAEADNVAITVDDSTFTDNSGGWGGGIGTFGDSNTLHVSGSTFNGNHSADSGGAVQMAIEALETAPAVPGQDAATFVNSTITGNSQGGSGAVNVDGTLDLSYVTMTDNTNTGEPVRGSTRGVRPAAPGANDAASIVSAGLTSFASVVTGPSGGPNCESVDLATEDSGYNFSDDASCGFDASTSNVHTPNDPVLGALADNSGPTETLLPLAGSPLLDAIPTTTCTDFGITVDQRGITRPQGTGCDVGAVEVEANTASLEVTKVVTGTSGNPVPSAGYTFTVSCSDGTTGTLTVTDATAGGTSGTLDGIGAGATCQVTEAPVVYTKATVTGQPAVTYAPSAAGSTPGVVVNEGLNTVTVTNNYTGINLLGAVAAAVVVEPKFTG